MNQAESTGIAVSLFEIFPLCRKLIFSSLDMKDLNLTKSQLSILFALEVKPCLTMSRLSKYIGSSKEQTTRAVAPLAKEGLVERYMEICLHSAIRKGHMYDTESKTGFYQSSQAVL